MPDQLDNFPGSLASKGLPTPVLNELERLIEDEHITEATVVEQSPQLSEKLMHFFQQEYHTSVENQKDFTALVTAETWNYLYQKRDEEAAKNN
jgi:hypothetical protein